MTTHPRLVIFTDLDVQQAHADLKRAGQPFTRTKVATRAIEIATTRHMKPEAPKQPEPKASPF